VVEMKEAKKLARCLFISGTKEAKKLLAIVCVSGD
jgi:hypothetical protein